MDELATLVWRREELEEAAEIYREVITIRDRASPNHPHQADTCHTLGIIVTQLGQYPEGVGWFRRALDLFRSTGDTSRVAFEQGYLGWALSECGQFEEAEQLLQDAVATMRSSFGDAHPSLAGKLQQLASFELSRGEPVRAEEAARQALDIRMNSPLGPDHPETLISRLQLNVARMHQGLLDGVEPELRDILERVRSAEPRHRRVVYPMQQLANLLILLDRAGEAEPILREALAIGADARPQKHPETMATQSTLGACLTSLGRYREAESLLLESHAAIAAARTDRHHVTREALDRVIALYDAWHSADPDAGYGRQAEGWRDTLQKIEPE